MISRIVRISPIFFIASAAIAAACSSSSGDDTSAQNGDAGAGDSGSGDSAVCVAYTPPSGTDLTTPTVSFRQDVMPIISVTCALSDCHAYPGDLQTEGLILGVSEAGVDETDAGADGGDGGIAAGSVSAIVANIVGVPSKELKTMNRVTASDPSNSYLQHKIDGDQCLYNAQCIDQSCNDQMPDKSDQLTEASRLVIRRWIAQGALDN